MILLIHQSYKGTAHEFRQYFFDALTPHQYDARLGLSFNEIQARYGKPDGIILFTIKKCGYIKGLENFKGPMVLYECDSSTYHQRILDYLTTYKNIRLLTLEFFPDCDWQYPVEHMWMPPAVTDLDIDRHMPRVYDFGHCGNYATYRKWHRNRLHFAENVLPKTSLTMEIRGECLETIGRKSQPIHSSLELSLFANQVKLMFACPTKNDWLTHQYFYPLANGCMVIGHKPAGFNEQMIPECLVELRADYADVEEKVKFYLNNPLELGAITQRAYDHVQKNHTIHNRVQTLLKKMEVL